MTPPRQLDKKRPGLAVVAILGLVLLVPAFASAAEEIVTVPTRPGVTLRVLLMTPSGAPSGTTGATPAGTLLMFPGGLGADHFKEQPGRIHRGGNFLVRSAYLFVHRNFVVAIVDVPSDQAGGMSDAFRTGSDHAADVTKVIDMLAARDPGPLALVGTSRGTLSAAYLAATLRDPRVTSVVLTSSMVERPPVPGRWMTLDQLPVEKISIPTLVVHHREDACRATPINGARRLTSSLKRSSRLDFVEVRGGDPPRSDPCQAMSAHGFLGKEGDVVAVITDWIEGKPVPKQIGP